MCARGQQRERPKCFSARGPAPAVPHGATDHRRLFHDNFDATKFNTQLFSGNSHVSSTPQPHVTRRYSSSPQKNPYENGEGEKTRLHEQAGCGVKIAMLHVYVKEEQSNCFLRCLQMPEITRGKVWKENTKIAS